jgi:hypothetical protein
MSLARFLHTSYLDLMRQPLTKLGHQLRLAEKLAQQIREANSP